MMARRERIESPGFHGRPCVALAHKREPERLFVILTAYLDESGTHGGDGSAKNPASPTLVMAGMMGTASQWARFEVDFAKLRRHYGFRVLHMLDFKKVQKEFAGWDNIKRMEFLRDFGAIIRSDKIMEGVTFRLDHNAYRNEYIAVRPNKPQLDSAYGLCFRTCMLHFLLDAERRLGHGKRWDQTRLHVVLENGHKNRGDALRIFEELKTESAKAGNHTLATITFSGKNECDPLMVGDFLAHTVWSMDQVQKAQERPSEEFFGNGVRGKSNITHIAYVPGGLGNVRNALISKRPARKRVPSSSLMPQDDAHDAG